MATPNAPTIYVHKFWTNYEQDPANPGKLRSVDMVSYGPVGGLDRNITTDKVSRLSKVIVDNGGNNPAASMALARWNAIEPRYKAWKSGQELPDHGTPLSAWNALSPEQADVLRMHGVKTVEDIAGLTDTHIQRLPVPHLRELIKQAKLFVDSADTARVSAELAKRDEKIALQDAEMADMRQKLDEMAQMLADQQTAARKPGRPRKAA